MKLLNNKNYLRKGFTLIELLVVIAVLGVLAAAVVAAINPIAKINQAKDSTAKSDMGQIANALQAYFTTNLKYPLVDAAGAPGLGDLVTANELKSLPNQQTTALACAGAPNGTSVGSTYCYTSTVTTGVASALWGAMYGGVAGDYFCIDSTSAILKKCATAVTKPTQASPQCGAACVTP